MLGSLFTLLVGNLSISLGRCMQLMFFQHFEQPTFNRRAMGQRVIAVIPKPKLTTSCIAPFWELNEFSFNGGKGERISQQDVGVQDFGDGLDPDIASIHRQVFDVIGRKAKTERFNSSP